MLSTRALDSLAVARDVLWSEATAIRNVAARLDDGFAEAVDLLDGAVGRVVVSGVGKSAAIGRKLVATFNSTGTRSYFLDPLNARHGDLGAIHPDDVALLLSHGGESVELTTLLPVLRAMTAGIVAITSRRQSTLAAAAQAVIAYGPVTEADPLGLAPSSSTAVMHALGDALAFALAQRREFSADEFARYHPAGQLGLALSRVDDFMRTGSALRLARTQETVRDVFSRPGQFRRTGVVLVVDDHDAFVGLFTDSDLARLFARRTSRAFDRPIAEVMTTDPHTVRCGTLLTEALDQFRTFRISELPVLDDQGRLAGLLDITDLLHLMPGDPEETRHAA